MYELKKLERCLRVNLLGRGPSSYEKRIYRTAGAQRFRNTGLGYRLMIRSSNSDQSNIIFFFNSLDRLRGGSILQVSA
jgi:hypothetical protein